ncbi:Di-copper centre-containing protein [Coprinopsis marcescibilis]|uniref:Di-copper centre-containing protein n=1 Tax=Coprinopsis marcescibilis TaxID=230819 RepID=A0A5C3KS79_COPMA|nr:Di-copper centre-containing protein [Coprinopsis marcescibilis]
MIKPLSLTASLLACLVLSLTVTAASVPVVNTRSTCSKIQVRREWRDLAIDQRLGYIKAVLCLQSLPPTDTTRTATTRFEEFQATHIYLTERIHSVGQFLPWHRHLVTLYNNALREECGYHGPETFWDWTRDGDSNRPILESPIFDPVTGFGGDGVPGTYTLPPDPDGLSSVPFPARWKGCVQDGPFNATVINLGPGRLLTKHCLVRDIDESWKFTMTSENVAKQMDASKTYEQFRVIIDNLVNGIHGSGHVLVGGEMTNTYSADPLFYMHHSNLDRFWWKWQMVDPENRMFDVSGPTTQTGKVEVTLDFELDFPALSHNYTVRDIMDPSVGPGCFVYE